MAMLTSRIAGYRWIYRMNIMTDKPDDEDTHSTEESSDKAIAEELAGRLRKDFGLDMRHPVGLHWLTACVREIRGR